MAGAGKGKPNNSRKSGSGGGKTAKKRNNIKRTERDFKMEERRDLVYEYIVSGAGRNLRAIAQLLTDKGYPCSHETVRNDIAAVYERLKAKPDDKCEVLRAIESDRLDSLQLAYWALAMKGNINAGWLVLGISSARRDLHNIDKPKTTKVEINVSDALSRLLGVSPDQLPKSND